MAALTLAAATAGAQAGYGVANNTVWQTIMRAPRRSRASVQGLVRIVRLVFSRLWRLGLRIEGVTGYTFAIRPQQI